MSVDHFDGFSIHLQEEGDEVLAYFIELPSVSAYGDTAEEALKELNLAWEAMKQSYKKHNESIPIAPARKEYSGQFNVRIDKRLHKALVLESEAAGVSLNALVAEKLLLQTFAQKERR